MILTATKTLDQNANAADAAKRGAFWDLTEYLQDSEAYPNPVSYTHLRVRSLLLFGFYAQYIDLVIVLGAGAGDVGDQGVDLHDQRPAHAGGRRPHPGARLRVH